MTYGDKLKMYNDSSRDKMKEYRQVSTEIKKSIMGGRTVAVELFNEQDKAFTAYHRCMRMYNELVNFLMKNKIPFTAEYKKPE